MLEKMKTTMTFTVSRKSSQRNRAWLVVASLIAVVSRLRVAQVLAQSTSSHDDSERDPALQEMQYDVGDGPQTSMVYVEPDLNSFYNINKDDTIDSDDLASTTTTKSYSRVEPEFNGFGGKFINMSNKYLDFHWEDEEDGA